MRKMDKARAKAETKCENVKFLVLINPHNRLLIESSAHNLQSTFYRPHSTFPEHSSLSCCWVGRAFISLSLSRYLSPTLMSVWTAPCTLFDAILISNWFRSLLSISPSLRIRRRSALCCRELIPSWDWSWNRARVRGREQGQLMLLADSRRVVARLICAVGFNWIVFTGHLINIIAEVLCLRIFPLALLLPISCVLLLFDTWADFDGLFGLTKLCLSVWAQQ